MNDDLYWDMIQERWDAIILMYNTFRNKDQIIEFDVTDQKIYSYPAGDYINSLSERTREQTAQQFAEAKKRNQFILFVKDTQNKRLRSYILDLPK
ncbi:MAG: hypothetical protein GXX96_36035 [Planctomycetaceae bacterium]|nr:hypothetical protein [Planctomycetaceae bacterium]